MRLGCNVSTTLWGADVRWSCSCPQRDLRMLYINTLPHTAASQKERNSIIDAFPLADTLFSRRVRWGDKKLISDGAAEDHNSCKDNAVSFPWLRRSATVVLLECAVVWYSVLDLTVLTVVGALGAVSSLESATACRASAVVVVLLRAAQLVVCALLHPFTTMFSHIHTLFTLAFSALSVVCQMWYLFESQAIGVHLDSLSKLLTVSAVCDLLVSGASMIRTLLDGSDAARRCYRNANTLRRARVPLPPGRQWPMTSSPALMRFRH